MASSSKYSKMKDFATAAGQDYEKLFCALLFLRARNRGLEFQLGSNVKGAGDFGNVVFRSKIPSGRWETMYVQVKHRNKNNSWVKRCMLTGPMGNFSLPSYFKYYQKIGKATEPETLLDGSLEHSKFVIFTNAKGNEDLGKPFSGNLSQMEEFVRFSSGSVYSFKPDAQMQECLGEEGYQFLNQFQLFSDQPNVNGLKGAVREELLKLEAKTIRGLNFDRLCDCYLANVKAWLETKITRDILNENHNILQHAIDKVRLESCSEKTMNLYELDLDFDQEDICVPDAGLSVVKCTEATFRPNLTKLVQACRRQCFVLTCQQLLENKRALLAARDETHFNCLIVCTRDWHSDLSNECFEVIKQLLSISDPLKIVFLQDKNSGGGSELNRFILSLSPCSFSHVCLDKFDIGQLTAESRDELLDKPVDVKGYTTTLLELFAFNYQYAFVNLTASFVAAVMESLVPFEATSYLSEDMGFFVEDTLKRASEKASMLHDLQGTATIRVGQDNTFGRTFLETALDFVCLIKYSPSYSRKNKIDVLNQLTQSRVDLVRDNGDVYVGPKFPLGLYECNCVGLRFGRDDAVTALRVCPSRDASEKASFLFVSDETNKEDQRKFSEFYKSRHFLLLKNGKLSQIQSHDNNKSYCC